MEFYKQGEATKWLSNPPELFVIYTIIFYIFYIELKVFR